MLTRLNLTKENIHIQTSICTFPLLINTSSEGISNFWNEHTEYFMDSPTSGPAPHGLECISHTFLSLQ